MFFPIHEMTIPTLLGRVQTKTVHVLRIRGWGMAWGGAKNVYVNLNMLWLFMLCVGAGDSSGFLHTRSLKTKLPLNSYVCPKSKRLWSWLTASSEAWRWLHLLPPRPLHATGGCRANRCSPFRGQPVNPWYPWMTWDWCSWTALICGSLKPS